MNEKALEAVKAAIVKINGDHYADYDERIARAAISSYEAETGWRLVPEMAQLGGAPDDLHNFIKVACAEMPLDKIGELVREVIARRNPALAASPPEQEPRT